MAFDSLSEKLQNVFKNLRSKGRLTVMGRPAKVTRALTEEEIAGLKESALSYIEEGKKLREEGYCL